MENFIFHAVSAVFLVTEIFYENLVTNRWTHFTPMFYFYIPSTLTENVRNQWFSDVIRGYRNGLLAWIGLRKDSGVYYNSEFGNILVQFFFKSFCNFLSNVFPKIGKLRIFFKRSMTSYKCSQKYRDLHIFKRNSYTTLTLHKKRSFPWRISSVNVTESAGMQSNFLRL